MATTSSTALFGSASIVVTSTQKVCTKVNENILLLQGLANVLDGSGNIADLNLTTPNTVTVLQAIGQLVTFLINRGWASAQSNGSNQVNLIFNVPYNTTLQAAASLPLYTMTLPAHLYMTTGSAGAPVTFSATASDSAVASQWQPHTGAYMYAVAVNNYINDLVNLQMYFENLNDMMIALNVINQ